MGMERDKVEILAALVRDAVNGITKAEEQVGQARTLLFDAEKSLNYWKYRLIELADHAEIDGGV
jgi:hypothetical protein